MKAAQSATWDTPDSSARLEAMDLALDLTELTLILICVDKQDFSRVAPATCTTQHRTRTVPDVVTAIRDCHADAITAKHVTLATLRIAAQVSSPLSPWTLALLTLAIHHAVLIWTVLITYAATLRTQLASLITQETDVWAPRLVSTCATSVAPMCQAVRKRLTLLT